MTDNGLLLQVTDNGRGYNPGNVPQTGRDTGTGLRLLTRTIHIPFKSCYLRFDKKKRGFRLSIQGVNTIFAQLRVTGITPKDYSTRNSHTPTYKHGKQPLKITSTFFMLHSVQSGLALPVPSPYKKHCQFFI